MSAFYELRIYKIFPNKMEEWINFFEKQIRQRLRILFLIIN